MPLNATTARSGAIAYLTANTPDDWATIDATPGHAKRPVIDGMAALFLGIGNWLKANATITVAVTGTTSTPNVATGGATAAGTASASGSGTLT